MLNPAAGASLVGSIFLLITSKGEQMTFRSRRLMPGLLAILVVLALAPSSFAQIQVTITPTPSAGEINTNHAAITQDPGSPGAGVLVTGAVLAQSPLSTTTLILTYSATITSSPLNCVFGTSPDNPTVNATFPQTENTGTISGSSLSQQTCSS